MHAGLISHSETGGVGARRVGLRGRAPTDMSAPVRIRTCHRKHHLCIHAIPITAILRVFLVGNSRKAERRELVTASHVVLPVGFNPAIYQLEQHT